MLLHTLSHEIDYSLQLFQLANQLSVYIINTRAGSLCYMKEWKYSYDDASDTCMENAETSSILLLCIPRDWYA